MVDLNKIIKKTIFILVFFYSIANSNIIYDKNNTQISAIEIDNYIQLNNNFYSEKIDYSKALKDLIIGKKVIKKLENSNPEYLKYLDKLIKDELRIINIHEIEKLFLRVYLIKRDFIYNYFNNSLTFEDMKGALVNFEKINLPISKNECMFISNLTNLNDQIINKIYKYYKKETNTLDITIDNEEYTLCLDQKMKSKIDNNLTKMIELKTNKDYLRFVYENIK